MMCIKRITHHEERLGRPDDFFPDFQVQLEIVRNDALNPMKSLQAWAYWRREYESEVTVHVIAQTDSLRYKHLSDCAYFTFCFIYDLNGYSRNNRMRPRPESITKLSPQPVC